MISERSWTSSVLTVIVDEPNELAAPPLAAARGIPNVVVGFGAYEPAEPMAAAEDALQALWQAEALDLPPWAGLYQHLYLHPFPASLGPTPSFGTIRAMRPMGFDGIDNGDPPDWLSRIGRSRPLAYVTFGTEMAALAPIGTVTEAVADLDVDVVVTVGRVLTPIRSCHVPRTCGSSGTCRSG